MPRICKDCYPDKESRETAALMGGAEVGGRLLKARPAPYPGPRCASHDREKRRKAKEQSHGKYVQRTYGFGEHDYGYLYEAQNGTCAICERATGATRKLSVDHDHKCCAQSTSCGACVRGLLCRPCNDLLGHCRDDWRMLARAIRYLQAPPGADVIRKRRGGLT